MAMTDVSPVTEAEVTTFAQRIVTTIVSVSQQAREIEVLSNRLNSLATEINGYMDETRRLKAEVAEGWEFVKTVEHERDEAKRAAQEAEGRVAQAQQDAAKAYSERDTVRTDLNDRIDDIVRSTQGMKAVYEDEAKVRDARIAELEQALASAQTKAYDNEQRANTLDQRNEWQAGELRNLRGENERYAVELRDCHTALDASNTKLTTVQAKLNDLRSLFDAPKEVEPDPIVREFHSLGL